jgi:hypothetical protein
MQPPNRLPCPHVMPRATQPPLPFSRPPAASGARRQRTQRTAPGCPPAPRRALLQPRHCVWQLALAVTGWGSAQAPVAARTGAASAWHDRGETVRGMGERVDGRRGPADMGRARGSEGSRPAGWGRDDTRKKQRDSAPPRGRAGRAAAARSAFLRALHALRTRTPPPPPPAAAWRAPRACRCWRGPRRAPPRTGRTARRARPASRTRPPGGFEIGRGGEGRKSGRATHFRVARRQGVALPFHLHGGIPLPKSAHPCGTPWSSIARTAP